MPPQVSEGSTGEALTYSGQLLSLAFAAGLNLYATVALLGLGVRLGLVDTLPTELRGLQHPIVIASAVTLYLVEFVVEKIPRYNTAWDALHTVIRPAAAATLAVAALGEAPLVLRVVVAGLAGATALLAHGTMAGVRVTVLAGRGPGSHAATSLGEDALAVGMTSAALRLPSLAPAIAAAAIAATLPFLPRLTRALVLGLRAARARRRGLFFGGHWHRPSELPRDLRALVDTGSFGFGSPAAARVAVHGLGGVGAYRNGWLVLAHDHPVFLFRARFRPHALALPPGQPELHPGFWADVVFVRGEHTRYRIYFLKDGPAPDLLLAGLAPPAPVLV